MTVSQEAALRELNPATLMTDEELREAAGQ